MSASDSSVSDTPMDESHEQTDLSKNVVVESSVQPKVGDYIGQCKWWADKLGYGFLTIQTGPEKGKDIFVHHSGIRPLNSNYKTLKKGEYVNFDIVEGNHGQQAVNVTGIGGGSLICDVNPYIRTSASPQRLAQPGATQTSPVQQQTSFRRESGNPNRYRQRVTATSTN